MTTTYDEKQQTLTIDDIIKGIANTVTMEDFSAKMNEKQEELDAAVKRIEQLDIEAQEKSKFSYVR
ncbi:hypothetical protein [Sulfurimonas sp.]